MKGKTVRVKRRVRDYAMIAAIVAIFLSVAVMFGIAYSYPSESEKHQLALEISPRLDGSGPTQVRTCLRAPACIRWRRMGGPTSVPGTGR
jgi:hypothetical protein